jgi:hypothetical protein
MKLKHLWLVESYIRLIAGAQQDRCCPWLQAGELNTFNTPRSTRYGI